MLTSYQQELIHREIDGENSPDESVEVQKLVETQPEALALMTSLRSLDALFREVPDRVPPPRVTQSIHNAMSLNSRASPTTLHAQGTTQTITRWATQHWNGVSNFMEEWMSTKRVLIIATTAVAAIAIIGQLIVGYRPSPYDAGTVGAGTGISGVEKAGRFRGRTMTTADVTLSNPEIGALFQNDKVLKLVQSDAFHEAMHNDAFRELTSSAAFRQLESSAAFQEMMASGAFQTLLSSDAFHDVIAHDASYQAFLVAANDPNHQVGAVAANDAAHQASNSDAVQRIMANAAFRGLLANDAFREVLANDAFHTLFANDAFHAVFANDAFQQVLANDAFQNLLASDAFLAIAHSASLSDAFLNEAAHVQ